MNARERNAGECGCAFITIRKAWKRFKRKTGINIMKNLHRDTLCGVLLIASALLIPLLWYTSDDKGKLESLFAGWAFIGMLLTLRHQIKSFNRQMDMAAIQNLYAAEALRMERIEKLYEKSEKLIQSSNMAGYNKNDIIGKNFLLKFRRLAHKVNQIISAPKGTNTADMYQELAECLYTVTHIISFCSPWAVCVHGWEEELRQLNIRDSEKQKLEMNLWRGLYYDDAILLSACYIDLEYIEWDKKEIEYLESDGDFTRPSILSIVLSLPEEIHPIRSGETAYILYSLIQEHPKINLKDKPKATGIVAGAMLQARQRYRELDKTLRFAIQ